ncbi:hypothetical protein [Photobacterium kishitanii]|uniref:Uncharacterized protein n=1 Tax=Photobacterium kishitanii TaxID=318456 RepID=A0A2T3KMA4_9GAMM|nr:hypothetical protein [Photobacterium kishitanii]PSV00937.1 hypothetical protein C9J27_02625 [Photobacterium kishitanii]
MTDCYDLQDLPKLGSILKKFPFAKARRTKVILDLIYDNFYIHPNEIVVHHNIMSKTQDSGRLSVFSGDEYDGLFFNWDDFDSTRITPKGASALVKFYQSGMFCTECGKVGDIPDEVLNFINSEDELKNKKIQREKEAEKTKARIIFEMDNLDLISESDFRHDVLTAIFIKHVGDIPQPTTVKIGGLDVIKVNHDFLSNSENCAPKGFSFYWTSPDGTQRSL